MLEDKGKLIAIDLIMYRVTKLGKATVITIFAILALHGFLTNITAFCEKYTLSFFPWFGFVIGLSTLYLLSLARATSNSKINKLVCVVILASVAIRLLWIIYFDSQLYSDFRTYWNLGESIVRNGVRESAHFGLYFLRSIFYTAPIQYLFGNNQAALEIVNVLLITLSMLIFYIFGKKAFNAKIAAGSLLFFCWNPDIWYGVTLANHDISFLPWFALTCLLVYSLSSRLYQNKASVATMALSAGVGILLFILNAIRSFGLPAWFALLLVFFQFLFVSLKGGVLKSSENQPIFNAPRARIKPLLMGMMGFLVVPLGAYIIAGISFNHLSGFRDSKIDVISYVSANDVLGSSRYHQMREWYSHDSKLLPADQKNSVCLRKYVLEMTVSPKETLLYLLRKNQTLARSDGTLSFSSRKAKDPWIGRVNDKNVGMQKALHQVLTSLLLFLLFIRLVLNRIYSMNIHGSFLVFFSASLYLFQLLFTEAQPRYDLFSVFIVSLYVAQLIFPPLSPRNGENRRPIWIDRMRLSLSSHFIGLAGIIVLFGIYIGVSFCLRGSRFSMADMRGFRLVEKARSQVDPLGGDRTKTRTESMGLKAFLGGEKVSSPGTIASAYYLPTREVNPFLSMDLASWDLASRIWIPGDDGVILKRNDESLIQMSLPVKEKSYYVKTWPGSSSSPPAAANTLFGGNLSGRKIICDLEYALERDAESLILYLIQYDKEKRIETKSIGLSSIKGRHSVREAMRLLENTKSIRVLFRFINKRKNGMTLKKLHIFDDNKYKIILDKIENNYKKMSFELNPAYLAEAGGSICFEKTLRLKRRKEIKALQYFVSARAENIPMASLDYMNVMVFVNNELVRTTKVKDIDRKMFINNSLADFHFRLPITVSFRISCDSVPADAELFQKENKILMSVEYICVR